ncbi:MAG: methylmalonyl-CoA mutase small subunit [Bacteroidia bacterium]
MFQDFEKQSKESWQQKAEKDLKGKPLEKINWRTFEGIVTQPYYTTQDLANNSNKTLIPGQAPYLRSQKELGNGWLIREEIGQYKNFKATNKKALNAIEHGAHNLVFATKAFSDGFDGIPVKNIEDLAQLLEGIDPAQTGVSFKTGETGPFYLKLLHDWAQNAGHDASQVFGSIDHDPLGAFISSGVSSPSIENTFAHLAEVITYTKENFAHYKSLNIHSSTFHNGGASIVQELAFTLAVANEYLHQFEEHGLKLDDFFNHLQVELSVGGSYFQEIAKIRAFRWLWATLAGEYTKNTEAQTCYLVARSSEWNKSVYDPYVNMLRLTTEAMSASIAGADEIQLDGYDKGFRPTNEFSERISRNLHHLLTEESYLDKSVDPAGGSYYIEKLTEDIAMTAWELFKTVEEKGGILALAKSGWLQTELRKSRRSREERLATRKEKFLGVNEFPNPNDKALDLVVEGKPRTPFTTEVDEESNWQNMSNVRQYADWLLKGGSENCEPVKHYVATEAFEQLRAGTEIAKQEGQKLTSFFLMPLGNKSMRSARANFALNFYQCGGFEVINNAGFDSVETAIEAFKANPTGVLVICSSDAEYKELIPQIGKKLKQAGILPKLALAGYPGDKKEDYEDMGVEEFIYMGCNVFDILKAYVNK